MAGGAGADFLVGRIFRGPARETAGDGDDAGDALENGFHAPVTAAAEVSEFSVIGIHRLSECRGFAAQPDAEQRAQADHGAFYFSYHIQRAPLQFSLAASGSSRCSPAGNSA